MTAPAPLGWKGAFQRFLSGDPLSGACSLTLVLLVLYSGRSWTVEIPMAVLCALGLAMPRLRTAPQLWAPLAAIMTLGFFSRLYVVDNHKVLTALWCLALLGATVRRDPESLRRTATWFIGLCFLFATAWKLATPDFSDGNFMEYTYLADRRFWGFVGWTTGFGRDLVAANMEALAAAVESVRYLPNPADVESVRVSLESTAGVQRLADFGTWYTIGLEGLIAVCFLGAGTFRVLHRLRNLALATFLFTTYSVATVIGFGWLLAIMGFVQCKERERRGRILFLAAFVVLQLFRIPWSSALDDLLGSPLWGGTS